MSYYMGDYYQGDYYTGDPGIGAFLKKGIGMAVRGGRSLLGLPAAGAGTAISMALGKLPMRGTMAVGGRIIRRGVAQVVKHPVISAAAAAGVVGALAGREEGMIGMVPEGTKGFHMSKPRRGSSPHLVRNRRMHVTNPRALRRAIRRAAGFAKLARKVMHFTSPRPPRGRAYFRPKRRAASRARA